MNHRQITRINPARKVAGILSLLGLLATIPGLIAQNQPDEREGEARWQRDLVAFEEHLKSLAAAARTPGAEELLARIENGTEGEGQSLGAAGVLDFRPPKDTVQFRVNEALKGKAVRWEVELADDPRDDGQIWLEPAWKAQVDAEPIPRGRHAIQMIMFRRNRAIMPPANLASGQRIVVEGRIGDSSKNRNFDSLHGATAFYHPQDIPMFFWVGLDKVHITHLDPTEEQLRSHVLSDKASLERQTWKVLEVNGTAEFDEKLAGHAFDGDVDTAWHTGGTEGEPKHPHSLLVDMGRAETIAGMRYLPPPQGEEDARPGPSVDEAPEPGPGDGVIGSCSLYVSDSREEMGEPVGGGTFTKFRVEQELGFAPVRGRYFKLVVHSAADGLSRTALAELNLLAPAVPIIEHPRDPALPPMAEAIERFELLKQGLRTPPAALKLTPTQRREWMRAHGEAGRRWEVSRDLIDQIADGQQAVYEALERAVAEHKLSPVTDANLYAVAALPQFATEKQRQEMALAAKGMEAVRLEFLAALKRILSHAQQDKLREFLAEPGSLLPPPEPRKPVAPTPLADDAPRVTDVLVAPDSLWRWLHPVDGVDPAKILPDFHSSFFAKDFDDTSWQTDNDSEGTTGGFGYGDSGFEGVDLGKPMVDNEGKRQGYSAYFRHRFTTGKSHRHLELRCQRDDGIIVYLDGKEVARDNMSDGEEAYALPASVTVGGESERTVYRIPLTLQGDLPAGDHLLAISLHNPQNPSSDLRIGGITLVEVEGK